MGDIGLPFSQQYMGVMGASNQCKKGECQDQGNQGVILHSGSQVARLSNGIQPTTQLGLLGRSFHTLKIDIDDPPAGGLEGGPVLADAVFLPSLAKAGLFKGSEGLQDFEGFVSPEEGFGQTEFAPGQVFVPKVSPAGWMASETKRSGRAFIFLLRSPSSISSSLP
jgi:hypothetical protein